MRQIINHSCLPNKFISRWFDENNNLIENSEIILDFNPVIKQANLTANFAICHYQARPKGLRKWGVFYKGKYFSVDKIDSLVPYESIWLDENSVTLPPNAVIVHRDCELLLTESTATIKAIS